jgi:hypothetical protein
MSIIDLDLSLAAIMLIVACEIVLLTFLFFISRFYELKFRQKTFSPIFIIAAVLVLLLLGIAVLGIYYYDALIIANLLTLGVLAVFGTRLFRIMTGVTK